MKPQKASPQDETGAWPFIRWIESRQRWMVDARTAKGGKRSFHKTKSEAEGAAIVARISKKNEGEAAFDDSKLAKYGWTVAKAIRFALDHLERREASKPIAEAVDALLAFKSGRVGAIRLADIKNRLARFTAKFSGRTIAGITPQEINAFLDAIPHPTTRNDYREEIVMLWGFARSNKWVAEELDKHLVQRAAEPDKSRVILSLAEVERLMAASVDDDIRALNALVLFGGCRREEVEKFDWSNINFKTGHIEISAAVSKVARERFSPITSNLRAWLAPIAKTSGPIVSRVLSHALRDTWKRAGIYPWPQDAHRHSFISYRRRIIGDAQTALDAGTSEAIIKKHYQRPVLPTDAKRFFAIQPTP